VVEQWSFLAGRVAAHGVLGHVEGAFRGVSHE
jgi:hypothetical protein